MTEATKEPRKRKLTSLFYNERLDQILAQASGRDAESLLGKSGLIGNSRNSVPGACCLLNLTTIWRAKLLTRKTGNRRHGSSPKTVLTPNGATDLNIPRARLATFEPQLVAPYQRRLLGFDEHVIRMYARGMLMLLSGLNATLTCYL